MEALEPELDWSDFVEGRTFPEVDIDLDDESVDAYLRATGEVNPLYARADGFVPPMYATLVRFVKASLGGRWPSGTIQLNHRLAMFRALRRRERLTIDVRIGSISARNGRWCFETVSVMRDGHGIAVGEQTTASIWAGALIAGAAAASSTQVAPPVRAVGVEPTIGPAAAAEATAEPLHTWIGPVVGKYSLPMLREFGRLAGALDPIHVDPVFASGTRYRRNIVQGRLAMSLLARLMLERLGERWLQEGELSVRFRKPIYVDQGVRAWATPRRAEPLCFDVWCENEQGERVIEGLARVGP